MEQSGYNSVGLIETIVDETHVFPYSNYSDALKSIPKAQEEFKEEFRLRSLNGGYILMSNRRALDVKGYIVGSDDPLEEKVEIFNKIKDLSKKVK